SPEGRELPAPTRFGDDDVPGELGMLARGLLGVPRYPVRLLRALPSTMPNVEDVPAIFGAIPGSGTAGRLARRIQRAVGAGESQERRRLPAPRTSFNGRISAHRRFAFGQLALDDVKAVKNEYGCTVNDVVVS